MAANDNLSADPVIALSDRIIDGLGPGHTVATEDCVEALLLVVAAVIIGGYAPAEDAAREFGERLVEMVETNDGEAGRELRAH